MNRNMISILGSLILIISAVWAEIPAEIPAGHRDSVVLQLPDVVVTAERLRHLRRDVAAAVSLVTAEELRWSVARTAT
ncbi:MAG: hypothetical protein ABIK22_05180, partial [candidate division WOR-3 bacterium]